MKVKTGCDLENTARFEELLRNEHFCQRVYTETERTHIAKSGHPAQSAAGLYCVKEAVSKALGRGLFGLLPSEIGVEWDELGAPFAVLAGSAAEQYGHLQITISISHTKDMAMATCVILEE